MSEIKEIFENFANPMISHEEYERCGQCLKQKLTADVAKEYLKKGLATPENLKAMLKEAQDLFEQSTLYKRVISMRKEGKDFPEIERVLALEGITP